MSTPENTIDEMEEQLFQALREIDLQMARLPFDELQARYTAVGERMAPQFAAEGHPDLALNVRRLVAENILSAALGARPADECEQLLGALIALGFLNLHHRAQIIYMVCGYFSHDPDHEELAQGLIDRYLLPLHADLTRALQNEEQEVYRFFLDRCDTLLARREPPEEPASAAP